MPFGLRFDDTGI